MWSLKAIPSLRSKGPITPKQALPLTVFSSISTTVIANGGHTMRSAKCRYCGKWFRTADRDCHQQGCSEKPARKRWHAYEDINEGDCRAALWTLKEWQRAGCPIWPWF